MQNGAYGGRESSICIPNLNFLHLYGGSSSGEWFLARNSRTPQMRYVSLGGAKSSSRPPITASKTSDSTRTYPTW